MKYIRISATSKLNVEKIHSALHIPVKPDAVFMKQRASKVPIYLEDRLNSFLNILEQYKIVSTVNKEQQPQKHIYQPSYYSRKSRIL